MNETQRNIKRYKAALPGLRERITASAMLLLVSLSMVVSASFAWITLSRAPEVSMLATTVAANGNLEIALAHGSMKDEQKRPEEVGIGDSSATEGQTVILSNVTWGNLVNLSDKSYGLDKISLRPALLSGYNLNSAPLYGATYSADGRVEDISETYKYASWTDAGDGSFYFAAGDKTQYGVRSISSVTTSNVTGNATINNMMSEVRKAYATTNNMYLDLINGVTMVDETRNVSAMDGLAMLLEVFVNEKAQSALKSGGDVYLDYQDTVTYTYRLLLEYQKILDAEGEALRLMANLQVFANGKSESTDYFKTVQDLRNASASVVENLGVSLESLTTYKSNYTSILSAIAGMKPFAELHDPDNDQSTEPVYWPDKIVNDAGETVAVDGIGKHVSKLVDVNTTTANGVQMNQITITNATTVIADPLKVVIKKGVLKDTEQRLGNMLGANDITVTIYIDTMGIGNKTAHVSTDAAMPFLSNKDMGTSGSMESTGGSDEVGLDTYGLAIDLWARTNVQDTVLILEGSTLYEEVEATCTNKDGETTGWYIASSGTEGTVDVYFMDGTDEEGNAVTYVYDMVSHTLIGIQTEMMTEDGGSYTFTRKINKVVSGYQGENRVWMDWEKMIEDQLLAEDNTTQGAGSCYVFYANPSDQTRILDLLKAFTIAFLDQEGNQLATAKLDIENAYDINGKVTVPMKVVSGVTYIDEEGEEQIGIRTMPRNVATWITAVIYLDGMMLTNEDVLASGVIEGRLNFQFGSSVPITGATNGPLAQKYRIVSAVASYGDAVSNDSNSPIEFEYDGDAKDITVTLTVEGDQPTNVSGFFIRSVGATHGTRTDSEDFKRNEDGTWSATFSLNKPGNYVMRSVIVDGSEYVLEMNPAVYIEGLSVTRVWCDPDGGMIMTADNYVDIDVEVGIDADPSLMPKQVRALFRSQTDNKEFTAVLSYNSTEDCWAGTARISASGTYTLEYLVMDGEYTELEKDDNPDTVDQQKTFIITLGMKTSVSCTGILADNGTQITTNNFKFESTEYDLSMRLRIYDDRGNEIKNLDNVSLYYAMDGGGTDEAGMKALNMTWNETTGYYTGTMTMANAGTYRFGRLEVTIDGTPNIIRNAPNAPVFEAVPPEPPEVDLVNNTTADYQFAPTANSAVMSVNMSYAQTADVWAVIKNAYNGDEYVVQSTSDQRERVDDPDDATNTNYFRFDFTVPVNKQGTVYPGGNYQGFQDGEWYIEEVWLQKVFDKDINFYASNVDETTGLPDRDDCLVFTVSNGTANSEERVYTDVVQKIFVNVSKGDSTNYKGDTVSGTFMQEQTFSGIKLDIFNWRNEPVKNISNVVLKVTHGGDTLDKGGYTTTASYPETLWTVSNDGSITYAASDLKLQLAGTYYAALSYQVDGQEFTVDKLMEFVVESEKPYAIITGISPTGSNPTAITYTKKFGTPTFKTGTNKTSEYSDYAATVYAVPKADNDGARRNGTFTSPTVKIKAENIGYCDGATLILPAGDATEITYSFTPNQSEVEKDLGRTIRSNVFNYHNLWYYYGHGVQTITTMTLEKNGNTFTVILDNAIVITNPTPKNPT